MARELKNIKLGEVSLVDKAANKKKFLFFKQEGTVKAESKKLKKNINIVIDSDGTVKGTKISVNKDDLGELRDFSFHFYSSDDSSRAVFCSYSKVVETEDGFSRSETFYLTKGDGQMHEDIKKQLDAYFGEDHKVDFEKAEKDDAIAKALETINEYRKEFPDALKDAVGTITKQTGFCDILITKVLEKNDTGKDTEAEKKAELEKAGKTLSKDTLVKITAALKSLESLVGKLSGSTEKSDNTDDTDDKTAVTKAIEEITKSIEGLEKKEEDTDAAELVKTLAALTKRLETVENNTGVKKSITHQDGDESENTDKKKWPSFSD